MKGTLAGLTAISIWATSATLIAYLSRIPPLEIVAYSWAISSVLLLAYFMLRGDDIAQYFRRPLNDYLFVIAGIGLYTAVYYMAFANAPAFEANALNYLWPIFLMSFLIIFQGAPLRFSSIAGMALGFAGCVILFFHQDGKPSFSSINYGHALAVLSALMWGLYSCFAKGKTYPVGFMIPVFIISGLLTFAAHSAAEIPVAPDGMEWILIFLIGVCRLAYVLWDYGMQKGDQVLITSASYFTPLVSSVLLAASGFGAASPSIALAAALIIAGCLVVNAAQLNKLRARFRR